MTPSSICKVEGATAWHKAAVSLPSVVCLTARVHVLRMCLQLIRWPLFLSNTEGTLTSARYAADSGASMLLS